MNIVVEIFYKDKRIFLSLVVFIRFLIFRGRIF